MFDYVVGVSLQCEKGHALEGFQTKDFDCVMSNITFEDGRLVSVTGRTTVCTCGRGVNVPHLVNLYTHCQHPDCAQTTPYGGTLGQWCEFNLHLDPNGTILEVERIGERFASPL